MRNLTAIFLTILFASIGSASARESSCISCHLSHDWVADTTIAADFISGDIHRNMGLDCSDCHGGDSRKGFKEGDPELAMNPARGYKAPPNRAGIPNFCARCHSDIEYMKKYNPKLPTDQLKLYRTSVHGKQLYGKNDTKVAVCTDCHGIHKILPSGDSRSKVYHNNIPGTCKSCHSDPGHMRGYKYKGKPIPTDQFDEYSKSIHGILVLEKGDNAAPSCNNCHGNHGATPPNLASVSAACGECHASNRDFFNNSPHKEAWKEMGYPECEQCHDNHYIHPSSDEMLGVAAGSLCLECHDDDSKGYMAASLMKASIDSLKAALEISEATVREAEVKGVEGGQARFDLGAAKDNLTRVRAVVHTFDPKQVTEITSAGIKTAEEVQLTAKAALGDIKTRQIGLGVSLIFILFFVVALLRKIRQVDKKTDFTVGDH